MNIKFLSLASGSSGNCYYLSNGNTSVLIDGGLGIRTVKKVLKDHCLNLGDVKAVFVTHDHADHIKAVGHLAGKHNIPIYATPEVHEGMRRSYCMTEKLADNMKRFISKGETVKVDDFEITCFEVPHDSTDNVGYSIKICDKVFTFITDIGRITPTVARFVSISDYLVMEANYDKSMLDCGPYPTHLKERIASGNGHLCNKELAEFISCNFPSRLKYLWLCHLSKDNNHPELALRTVEAALKSKNIIVGKDVEVIPLRRTSPTGIFEL